jgi:type IV pilus assembly protein PilC
MPLYNYKAVAIDGKKAHGRMEAASSNQLAAQLRGEGLFLLEAAQRQVVQQPVKLSTVEVADFCRQLAAMLSSGITLIRAMAIMSQRDLKPHVKKIYSGIIEDLQRGSTLSEAMAQLGKAFPALLVNMIRAGEQTGRMDVTALKMAETYDKEHRLNQKIRSATVYPVILVVLIVGVVLIVFTFVIPQFVGMFENMALPLPTRIVMAVSDFLISNGLYLLVGVVIAVAVLLYAFRQPGPGTALDKAKIGIPKMGKLLSTIYTARFARTLASLYVSGIPMIQALTIARGTIGNRYIESQFGNLLDALGNGQTLSQAIATIDGFEPKLRSTVLVGEESGRLEQMLESIADQYDYDSEMASQRMVSMIEPILIVVMAGIVGGVIISVMLPIYQLYGNVGAAGGI